MYIQSHIFIVKRELELEIIKSNAYALLQNSVDRGQELLIEQDPKLQSIGIKQVTELHPWNARKTNKGRVAFIKNAHLLTHQAQNAILKVIEEPSQNTLLVLIANSKESLLETILSRCKILVLDESEDKGREELATEFLNSNYTEQKNLVYDYAQDRKKLSEFIESFLHYYAVKESETIVSKYNQSMIELLRKWEESNLNSVNTKLIAQSILLHLGKYE